MRQTLVMDVIVDGGQWVLPNFRRFHKFEFNKIMRKVTITDHRNYMVLNLSDVKTIDLSPLWYSSEEYGHLTMRFEPSTITKITLTMSAKILP